ncbi:hypothetical protein C5748_12840 [Phyllobacterium phragmitis]|uniref:BA14K family protein n=1 Tax=Phyllobacterium phragmitis TaxID=2670329 RepID=A0A2S9IRF1_9HYPH|nr:hypothetical protein [Phyllobacterium phragmitis]PRD43089.1 hypothetical protein C5748_12840 [Phyllobacterium phragmitis]
MRKFILLTSTSALLGLGLFGANAQGYSGYNAADDFGVSEQNDLPPRLRQYSGGPDIGAITSSTGQSRMTAPYHVPALPSGMDRAYRGYNAADDFGPSEQNDLPFRFRR